MPGTDINLATGKARALPRIVLVDDHAAVLRQTSQLVSGQFQVIATMESGKELLRFAAVERPDLIVLDITLPELSGIQVAGRLKEVGSPAKIVFLTVHADPDYAREAFEVGGSAYVVKPRLASDIVPALKAALAGRQFVSPCPELMEIEVAHNRQDPP